MKIKFSELQIVQKETTGRCGPSGASRCSPPSHAGLWKLKSSQGSRGGQLLSFDGQPSHRARAIPQELQCQVLNRDIQSPEQRERRGNGAQPPPPKQRTGDDATPALRVFQEGIMPLFRFLSAMTRRLWLALMLLFASFFLRSCTVSRFCPWPFTLPTTAELSCLCLQ